MADAVPAALRLADVNIWKCATKATQLRSVKPIMVYWCEYWAVNQILAKELHNTDEGILSYTTALIDKLEQTKAENPTEDAIIDDTAGQAYVEQFAQETLDRAERVVKANRVTQQTAVTFDAAATFFHVVNIWGPVDQETQQKIKYAKWNAARIAKAIKEGKDPNESNPKPEEPVQPEPEPANAGPRPATVEDAPDTDSLRDVAGTSLPHSPAPAEPSPVSDPGFQLPGVPTNLSQPAAPSGYFGPDASITPPSNLPSAPTSWSTSPQHPSAPPVTWSPPAASPSSASGFYQQPSQPAAPPTAPPTFAASPPATAATAPLPTSPPTDSHRVIPTASAPAVPNALPPMGLAPPSGYAPVGAQPSGAFTTDEAAIVGAQKHAKWAISALNFEDVPTAVRELRRALELLTAT
ncbi:Vta1 like-domain-containing protein [Chaetomium sp. MPI-SDFR-AT-0129]|nr:Vta1 like-domain-containing protein [Chaetomium sp. MPI-SDFR-AT-0129]